MNFETLAHIGAVLTPILIFVGWAVKSHVDKQIAISENLMKTELYGSIERNKEKAFSEFKELKKDQSDSHEKLQTSIIGVKDFLRDKIDEIKKEIRQDMKDIKRNGSQD